MTSVDMPAFTDALHRIGRAFGKPVDAELVRDYFDDLKGYSLPLIEAALSHVRQTQRFFPRPVVILDACIEQARARASSGRDIPAHVDHQMGVYACRDCQDTGFERGLTCPGTGVCHIRGCGVQGADLDPHPFTRRCRCRSTNPVLIAERDATRRPAPGVAA